jgi:TPP-dependent pyruvate/acetoin dehydrogenase alpha subunit
MSVSVERATGMQSLAVRAAGYGIPGVCIDGNDVRKVIQETEKAVSRARKGDGPSLIECMVQRWSGHSISDADVYRTDEERFEAHRKDPIVRFRNELMKEGVIAEEDYHKIEEHVKAELDEVIRYCEEECTDPDPADILRGVYSSS